MLQEELDLAEYLQYLYRNEKATKEAVKDIDQAVIRQLIIHKTCSVYQCTKFLNEEFKKEGKSIAYKNVHKKIKELLRLQIIEKREDSESSSINHGAIHYGITSYGIYYLFKNAPNLSSNLIKEYSRDRLFKLFLYPYLKQDTIKRFKSNFMPTNLSRFLNSICSDISRSFVILEQIEKQGGFHISGFITSFFSDPDYEHEYGGPRDFIRYFATKKGVKWRDLDKVEVITLKEYEIFRITDGKIELILKVLPEEKKGIVLENESTICEFDVERHEEDYEISEWVPLTIERYLSGFYRPRVNSIVASNTITEFCLSIIDRYSDRLLVKRDPMFNQDIILLVKDTLFRRLLEGVKKNIDQRYNTVRALYDV